MRPSLALPVVLLVGLQGGCTTWAAHAGSLDQAIRPTDAPGQVRLVLQDHTRIPLFDPVLTADSVIGSAWSRAFPRAGIPRDQVRSVEVRQMSPSLTMLLIGGVFAGGRFVIGPMVESSILSGGAGSGFRVAP